MLKTLCCIVLTASIAFGQTSTVRKECAALQKGVDTAMGEVAGTSILQTAKATYVEELGIVIMIEVALESPRNPFSNPAPNDARAVLAKQKVVREKMEQFLTQKVASIQSLNMDQSVVIAVHLFNSNPVDVPNMPAQLIFKVKKQEPSRVVIREL
jgi:hypothetical protein